MSKFMKTVESYENLFDSSIIEKQDRELKSLIFESMVLTESIDIAYPVFEGELTDKIKKIATSIWEGIVKFFETIVDTIGSWINRLKALFIKRKNEEAKGDTPTKPEEKPKAEEKKADSQPSEDKKEEPAKQDPTKEEPKENSEVKYERELTIRLEDSVNIFDGSFNTSGYINNILSFIEKMHNDVKNMYKNIENTTDNDIEAAKKHNETQSVSIQNTLKNATKKEVACVINMGNFEKYMNQLAPIRNAFRTASKNLKNLGEMSSHLYWEASKKNEATAGKVSSIVTNVLNWVRKVINPVYESLGKVLTRMGSFLKK